ncbi:MAG: hypothetical protein ACI8PW_001652 [Methylophilaceae bacterium]|jgi:hypothetical protein
MTKSTKTDQVDYEIGYQKPPKANQFVKGQSGNPSGRPKGARNWATVMHAALEEKVTITENNSQRKVSKLEVATMQLVNKAAAGDQNSIRLLLQLVPGIEAIINSTGATSLSNEQDQKVLAEMLQRLEAPATEVIKADNAVNAEGGSYE